MTRRILLVEGALPDARLVQQRFAALDPAAWRLEHAVTLAGAVAHLSRARPDAVLLELELPDSTGIATLERVRGANPRIPVVVLTENEDEALGLRVLERGAEEHLVKSEVASARALARSLLHAIERGRTRERQTALAAQQAEAQEACLWGVAAGAGRAYDRLLNHILEELEPCFGRSKQGMSDALQRHLARIRTTVLEGERIGERLRFYASSQTASAKKDPQAGGPPEPARTDVALN